MAELLLYDQDSEAVYSVFTGKDEPEAEKIVGRLDLNSPIQNRAKIEIFYTDNQPEGDCTSRRHCLIEKFGNDYTVIDLRSENGTFLNGEPVTTSREIGDLLRNCDILRLGLHGLEVIIRK